MGGSGSGRKPKPDSLKLLQGTFRKDRAKPGKSGEKPDQKHPGPPKSLSCEAARLWKSTVQGWDLDQPGLNLLKLACQTLDDLRRAEKVLKDEGATVINPKTGMVQAHPCVKMVRDHRTTFLQIWRSLNLE